MPRCRVSTPATPVLTHEKQPVRKNDTAPGGRTPERGRNDLSRNSREARTGIYGATPPGTPRPCTLFPRPLRDVGQARFGVATPWRYAPPYAVWLLHNTRSGAGPCAGLALRILLLPLLRLLLAPVLWSVPARWSGSVVSWYSDVVRLGRARSTDRPWGWPPHPRPACGGLRTWAGHGGWSVWWPVEVKSHHALEERWAARLALASEAPLGAGRG